MTATGQITFKSYLEAAGQIAFETNLGYLSGGQTNSKQDAREAMRVVFSVLTKRICMHKTNFLRIYSNIVLKVILNCMNMQIATQLIMMYNL